MKPTITRVLAAVGAAAILVVGFDGVTYAATGGSLLLGKINKAGAATTVQRTTAGPALSLRTTSTSAAPMTVNGKGMVGNLNANFVGGNTAAQLIAKSAPTSLVFTDSSARANGVTYAPVAVPAGTYLLTFNANVVMTGTASKADPNEMVCYAYDITHGQDLGEGAWLDLWGSGSWYASPSFARVVTLASVSGIELSCSTGNGGWSVPGPGFGPTLAFTKIGTATQSALVP